MWKYLEEAYLIGELITLEVFRGNPLGGMMIIADCALLWRLIADAHWKTPGTILSLKVREMGLCLHAIFLVLVVIAGVAALYEGRYDILMWVIFGCHLGYVGTVYLTDRWAARNIPAPSEPWDVDVKAFFCASTLASSRVYTTNNLILFAAAGITSVLLEGVRVQQYWLPLFFEVMHILTFPIFRLAHWTSKQQPPTTTLLREVLTCCWACGLVAMAAAQYYYIHNFAYFASSVLVAITLLLHAFITVGSRWKMSWIKWN